MGRRGELDPHGVFVEGVRVVGLLDLNHVSTVTNLMLTDCALPDGIKCQHARLHHLHLSGSRLPFMVANRVHTEHDLCLQDVTITGAGDREGLRLVNARIGGFLNLRGSTVTNTGGPALNAEGIHIDSYLNLDGSTFSSDGEYSALRLVDARIGGSLYLHKSTITTSNGPAIDADRIHVDGDLFLRDATITGAGKLSALRLADARVGQLGLESARVGNESGPVMVLTQTHVDRALFFPASLVCPQSRQERRDRDCPESAHQFVVRGLEFNQLREITWQEWLHLLVHHTPEYSPQPYQQLATVERAAGHDNNTRTILIAQQNDLRRRAPAALGGPIARGRHRLWGWLGRYGYRAHRLVTALLIALVLAGATGYTAGQITTRTDHRAAERVQPATTPVTAPGAPCSTAELIGLGIDRGLPVGTTGLRTRCDLDTATRWGQAFTYLLWALQALLWALATLTIAAYTGLIRKTT